MLLAETPKHSWLASHITQKIWITTLARVFPHKNDYHPWRTCNNTENRWKHLKRKFHFSSYEKSKQK